ncbi:fatty acid hydroperoxide lyase, chloroplastic [Juglans microcarpa x Juglans regia]|uniref:fatty acid hydroperoxide lyase, chloroplastic n=1 Tax=Juglans microcarpa x Juglans regia TaxID=2249226 RepID=UPI001B7DCC01|nr:fatty acid hydroperoxide lyase, chloroplastic [Juglans microcarpa x Juglans regia]
MMICSSKMSVSPGVQSSSESPLSSARPPTSLPLRTIPGSHGWPLLGPISDRLDYFWFQGPETFFRKRIEKYKSTVFRTNVPPSFPFFTNVNPNVVAVLDTKSFSHLFDMDLVEKRNILVGDFMPSVKFTGDVRVCAYLDTSEPQHSHLKNFAMDILKQGSKTWVSEVLASLETMWDSIESTISKSGSASYLIPLQQFVFKFLMKSLIGADPSVSQEIADSGYIMLDRWLAVQLLPTVKIGVLQPLEEIFLHSWAYPFLLVSGDYNKLCDFVKKEGKEVLRRGETEFGLSTEDSLHNLLFILGFNAFGGFSVFLPGLVSRIVSDKTGLQEKIRKEVKEKGGSTLSFDSVKEMPLVMSVVYETLRLSPPVPTQYGRARKDFQLSSHDSVYNIKKGELLCGYQPLVMRDGKIFDEPESFKPDRFTNEKGSELLNYLYWSNGPQTGSPSASNKQCAAKDYVVLTAALFVAYIFSRFDSIVGDSSSITAVEKAK